VVRGLSGLGAWLLQRLSAVYLLIFPVLFFLEYRQVEGKDHAALVATLARPWIALAAGLCAFSLLTHAWVGMRDVVLDYVRPAALRLVLLVVLGGWLLVLGFWSAWLLLGVSLL